MKNVKKAAALILALALALALAACGEAPAVSTGTPEPTAGPSEGAVGVWDTAEYTEDTELGEGASTITVEVTAGDRTVAFTVHTDAENLRAALEPLGLIAGEESEFGLFLKSVNGISADYDADGFYWALYVEGEYASTGVDSTPVSDGGSYALVREAA